MKRVLRLLIVVWISLIPRHALFAEQLQDAADTTAAMEKTFQWFDTLGYPSFEDRRFVSVELQQWVHVADEPGDPLKTHGFLLSEDGDQFKLLKLDLSVETFEKPKDGVTRRWPATYEDAICERLAMERLKEMSEPTYPLAQRMRDFRNDVMTRTRLFVLARACHTQGHVQLAHQVMSCTIAIPDDETGKRLSIDQFQKKIADNISHVETWHCFVAFGDPLVSREELLRRFRWIAKHFPENRHGERVSSTIELLARMVEEDRKHAAEARLPLEDMPVTQRVEELIFQLRNQNGKQCFAPGPCDIFNDPRGTDSPAAHLVAIGQPALEQLIDSVDDDRFTRSVECHRSFLFSHRVLRVGECCFSIMTRISPTGRVWDKEQDRERTKSEMRTWFLGASGNE